MQKIIQPIFEKLGSERFLQGCKNVVTSNGNESFHHVLWGWAPKEQYNSSEEIQQAMYTSICLYNSGFFWTYKNLLHELDLLYCPDTLNIFLKIDQQCIADSDYKISDVAQDRRGKKRRTKNKLADAFVRDEGIKYSSGAFHSGT